MTFKRDKNGTPIVCFTIKTGVTLSSPYVPTENEVVKLADSITITVDGIPVAYDAGAEVCLVKDKSYTLSASVYAHKM